MLRQPATHMCEPQIGMSECGCVSLLDVCTFLWTEKTKNQRSINGLMDLKKPKSVYGISYIFIDASFSILE